MPAHRTHAVREARRQRRIAAQSNHALEAIIEHAHNPFRGAKKVLRAKVRAYGVGIYLAGALAYRVEWLESAAETIRVVCRMARATEYIRDRDWIPAVRAHYEGGAQ